MSAKGQYETLHIRACGLAVSDARVALPNLNNVAVRITNVAAGLTVFGLWLGDELRSPAPPKCIALLNIGDANVHEAAEVIGIGRYAKRDRRLVGCRPAAHVDDEPRVRKLDVSRRSLAVAPAQDAAAEDRFVKSKRSPDIGDDEKVCDGNPVLWRHLIGLLIDLNFAHGRLPFRCVRTRGRLAWRQSATLNASDFATT